MIIRQITIIGTGLIGGSLARALRVKGFHGRIVGCDEAPVLARARKYKVIDAGDTSPHEAILGSQVVVLATPVGRIIDLVKQIGGSLQSQTLLTDVGSTKFEIMKAAAGVMGKQAPQRFLGTHPMAGREQGGLANVDPNLFRDTAWFVTPFKNQNIDEGICAEWLGWIEAIGARIARIDPEQHDRLCAWISHVPQMISTALAAALVEEFGDELPLLEAGGRALREMTRISASPYSMWRDIALTNKRNLGDALLQIEQKIAHIRENLDTLQLKEEFEQAHHLKKVPGRE